MFPSWRLPLIAAVATILHAIPASAQPKPVAPQSSGTKAWALSEDEGYAYENLGKLHVYRLGTKNARFLLKGAKKVPRNTLFFVGANGQLYMRTGPYLESDGRFSFGPN